jgi:6-methylsalicylate decarboxylase
MFYNQKVDFHSHYLSPTYYEYLSKYEGTLPDGFPTPKWSLESHLSLMEKLGITFAFISVSSPNLSKAPKDEEIEMVHKINLEGAEIVKQAENKLGLFANLPLPHTKEAISEAKFAIEQLKADGFGLSTHYAGIYLGDEKYDSLMEYLDAIGAVVAIHPVEPASVPKGVNSELPIPAMEFLMDTTRTFTNMVMHNIFGRYPNIKWIFPHAGAFISVLSDRMSGFAMQFRNSMKNPVPLDFKADMRHVYFDMAGFPVNKQIHDLLLDVSADNFLYGSDAPYTPNAACIAQTGNLENTSNLNEDEKNKMFTFNAAKLMPKLNAILNIKCEGVPVNYGNVALTGKEKFSRGIRTFISKVYSIIFS